METGIFSSEKMTDVAQNRSMNGSDGLVVEKTEDSIVAKQDNSLAVPLIKQDQAVDNSKCSSTSIGTLTPIDEENPLEVGILSSKPVSNQKLEVKVNQERRISATEAESSCMSSSVCSDDLSEPSKSRSKFHAKLLHLLHHDEDNDHNLRNSQTDFKEKSRNILSPLFGFFGSPRNGRKSQQDDSNSQINSRLSASSSKMESKQNDDKSSRSSFSKSNKSITESLKSPPPVEKKESFLEKYTFCSSKIIGKGASGVVRLAKKYSGGDTVFAVKEFRKRRKDESYREYIKKLTSEFCIGSMLHHINIVETIDIVKDGDHWYEIMEYCPGGDLYSVIRDGSMGSDEIDCYFKQLIEGVAYLHSLGVAHRDLKPENLLVDDKGNLKITDFGVSEVFRVCWESKPHLSKGLCGSTPYISPEMFTTLEYDAQLVDIWSCGIIYYAMTFHGIPWESATLKDPNFKHFADHRSMQAEPLVRLPHGPRSLLFRMLEPDPAKRIRVEEIMEDEWFKRISICSRSHNGRQVIHEHKIVKK